MLMYFLDPQATNVDRYSVRGNIGRGFQWNTGVTHAVRNAVMDKVKVNKAVEEDCGSM